MVGRIKESFGTCASCELLLNKTCFTKENPHCDSVSFFHPLFAYIIFSTLFLRYVRAYFYRHHNSTFSAGVTTLLISSFSYKQIHSPLSSVIESFYGTKLCDRGHDRVDLDSWAGALNEPRITLLALALMIIYWKLNLKLSLCFSFNCALPHEGVLGSGNTAPSILDIGTRWSWVDSFTPRPVYSQGKTPRYPLDKSLGGPQSRSRRGGE
jgi:hypothetical protein